MYYFIRFCFLLRNIFALRSNIVQRFWSSIESVCQTLFLFVLFPFFMDVYFLSLYLAPNASLRFAFSHSLNATEILFRLFEISVSTILQKVNIKFRTLFIGNSGQATKLLLAHSLEHTFDIWIRNVLHWFNIFSGFRFFFLDSVSANRRHFSGSLWMKDFLRTVFHNQIIIFFVVASSHSISSGSRTLICMVKWFHLIAPRSASQTMHKVSKFHFKRHLVTTLRIKEIYIFNQFEWLVYLNLRIDFF